MSDVQKSNLEHLQDDLMSSDRRVALQANRYIIAVNLSMAGPRDVTPLSRRLAEVNKELEALDAAEAEDAEDVPTPDEAFDPASI